MWGSAGSRGQGKRGRSCYYHSKQRREERFSDITTSWHRSQWRQAYACMEIPPGFPLYLISFFCFLSSGWMEDLCNSVHHFIGGAWNWNRQQTSAELQTFSCGKRVQFCDLVCKLKQFCCYSGWKSFGWGDEVFETFARPLWGLTWNPSACIWSFLPKAETFAGTSGTECQFKRLESSFWARTIGVTCSVLVILAKKEVALNSCLDLDFSRGWNFYDVFKSKFGLQAVKRQLQLDSSSPDVHRCLVTIFAHIFFSRFFSLGAWIKDKLSSW